MEGRTWRRRGIPSLFRLSLNTIAKNVDYLEEIGDIPRELLEEVFAKCTWKQLLNLENFNPNLIKDDEDLWRKHALKEFEKHLDERPLFDSWREFFLCCLNKKEDKIQSAREKLRLKAQTDSEIQKARSIHKLETLQLVPTGRGRKGKDLGPQRSKEWNKFLKTAGLAPPPSTVKFSPYTAVATVRVTTAKKANSPTPPPSTPKKPEPKKNPKDEFLDFFFAKSDTAKRKSPEETQRDRKIQKLDSKDVGSARQSLPARSPTHTTPSQSPAPGLVRRAFSEPFKLTTSTSPATSPSASPVIRSLPASAPNFSPPHQKSKSGSTSPPLPHKKEALSPRLGPKPAPSKDSSKKRESDGETFKGFFFDASAHA